MHLKYEPASVTIVVTAAFTAAVKALELTDFYQVDKLGRRYRSGNFGAGKIPGSDDCRARID